MIGVRGIGSAEDAPSGGRRAKLWRYAGFLLSLERGSVCKNDTPAAGVGARQVCAAAGPAGPARGAYSCGRVHSDRMESALSGNDWAGRPVRQSDPAQPNPARPENAQQLGR